MPNLLFEAHLAKTMPGLKGSDTVFLDEDAENLTELFRVFAEGIEDDADLGDAFDCFAEYSGFTDKECEFMKDCLAHITEDVYGEEATDENVRSFLDDLNRPYPKANETSPSSKGFTPLAGENAVKRFLKSLTVAAAQDPYNNQGFKADRYKAFDREANRYGKNYSYANDFNNQRPSRPLTNPTLNVAFEAVDSVGMGAKTHYRVVNKLTNEYITGQITKEDAEAIAYDLNHDFISEVEQLEQQELHESYPTRKHFQDAANEVRAIEHPGVRQEIADHHATIFSKQNPRFDHSKFHQACGTKTKRERGIREESLDEVSRDKLSDYQMAASDDYRRAGKKTQYAVGLGDRDAAAELRRKRTNRAFGLGKAQDKLSGTNVKVRATEGTEIASLPIHENLHRPLNPAYLEAFKKQNWTMGGSVAQSDYSSSTSPVKDMKAAALLVEQRKRKFGENDLKTDELAAIHQKHRKK